SMRSEYKTHIYEIMRESEYIGNELSGLGDMRITFGGAPSFAREITKAQSSGACELHLVKFSADLSTAKGLEDVSWGDLVMGSMALTLHDFEITILSKFSALLYDDPIEQTPITLSYALLSSSSKFLGVGQNGDRHHVDTFLPAGIRGHVR